MRPFFLALAVMFSLPTTAQLTLAPQPIPLPQSSSPSGGAQAPASATISYPTFEIGMPLEETLKRFGLPDGCFVISPARHYPRAECDAVHSIWPRTLEVFHRKTATNEYELRMDFFADETASRLHPPIRLSSVRLIADRPRPVMETIVDIPEASALCASGCRFFGACFARNPTIIIVPDRPSDDDISLATLVGNHGVREAHMKFYPGMEFVAEDRCHGSGKMAISLESHITEMVIWQVAQFSLEEAQFISHFEAVK